MCGNQATRRDPSLRTALFRVGMSVFLVGTTVGAYFAKLKWFPVILLTNSIIFICSEFLSAFSKSSINRRLVDLASENVYLKRTVLATEKRLQDVIDGAPMMFAIRDKNGCYITINKEAERVTGLKRKDLRGKHPREILPPALVEFNDDQDRRALASYDPLPMEEIVYPSPDGKRYFLTTKFALKENDGNTYGLCAVSLEITYRKKMESDLKLAKEHAEEANRAKSAFLANMSHEIRTPLNAIVGFSEILAKKEIPSDRRIQFANIILKNSRELTALVNDILDLSKVEADKLQIERVPVSVRNIINDVRDVLSTKAMEKKISLKFHESEEVPASIRSDSTRIRQILINIIGNAIKFTPREGHVQVNTSYDHRLSQLQIKVKDNGVGILKSEWVKIFDPFHQADSSITRRFGGTGLGLALSRKLARILGGDVVLLESHPEAGSVFLIKVAAKVERQELALNMNDSMVEENALSGVRVLLAEDSPDNQLLCIHLLKSAGASIQLAENGQEALEKALTERFDVILMDVRMPVKDGLTVTKELREKGYTKPIVACTAHALKEEREASLQAGCNAHITKPIILQELVSIIKNLAS